MFKATSRPRRSLQPLWRYLTYERLCDLLNTGELFFAHLPTLSDGLEGTLSERTRARLFEFLLTTYGGNAAIATAMMADLDRDAENFFVNCWHMNDGESYLMWKAYADKAYAIQTTFERIQASFDGFNGLIDGRCVEYMDYSREASEFGNVFIPVVRKDLPYRDEREYRLIVWRPDRANANVAFQANTKGVRVPVDLDMLIERIYVSPRITSTPEDLTKLIAAKGLGSPLVSSVIREKAHVDRRARPDYAEQPDVRDE